MDSNYSGNVSKWLPRTSTNIEQCFNDSLVLSDIMGRLACKIAALLKNASKTNTYDQTNIKNLTRELEWIIPEYRMQLEVLTAKNSIFKYKFKYITFILKKNINIVIRFIKSLINEIVNCINDEYLKIVFRLVNVYNKILSLDHDISDSSVNIFYNDCPNILEFQKKISVTRILQILAKNRAEEYCHELIDCLLVNYQSSCEKDEARFNISNDMDISENSSIEIYTTLTKHLMPLIVKTVEVQKAIPNVESMQNLVNTQNGQIIRLFKIVKIISPYLLGSDATKIENDEVKLRRAAIKKGIEFYQEAAWSSVSSILDHIVLWWSPEVLAGRHSLESQHLKDWLQQFIQGNSVPFSVRPALHTLCDALGYHVTITAWDQLFRFAYTVAFECQSKASFEVSENSRESMVKGTDTGQKFIDVFKLLMSLNNECEMGVEWIVGASLLELPLSEQIVVLHRMDHSIHTMRLWAMQEAQMIAHTWNLDVFFLLVKGDIINCIDVLSYSKLPDHTNELKEPISVQVHVCTKMRAKIVSEITANIQLLKDTPALCINILAKICRHISLVNLHICFPKSNYWRKNSTIAPSAPSSYVEIYFERVLLPVLKVIEDSETFNMVLQIMCEAWLDYIYLHKIKFSEWGALQLLADFAHVLTWISDCSIISNKVQQQLLKNEVLRRCEGVGRLLLRHPGEAISMMKKLPKRTIINGSHESLGLERMPAEMYVPNQEQWLELRAKRQYNFCCL